MLDPNLENTIVFQKKLKCHSFGILDNLME
jgi:hypothetical protein